MTDKELKKLSRVQLLELLLEQTRRADDLEQQLQNAREQLRSRSIQVEEAGSLAEAALELNGVFSAAQQAADQYLQNVRSRNVILDEARQEAQKILEDAKRRAENLDRETEEACRRKTEKAEQDARRYWTELTGKFTAYMEQHPELKRNLLDQQSLKRTRSL